MRRVQIALYMLAVFVSGVVVGVFGHRLYTVRNVSASVSRTPDEYRRKYVDELRSRLQLSDAQAVRLNAILDETHDRWKAFREAHKAETDAIHEEQVTAIRGMLDQSQQSEYEKFRQEREKRRKSSGSGR